MVPPDVEATDVFDFGQACVDIDLKERKEEYYRGLLDARDLTEKALTRVLTETKETTIHESLDDQLRHQPVKGMRRVLLDSWVRRQHHTKTKILPAAALSALALIGYIGNNAYQNHKLVVAERGAERAVAETAGAYAGVAGSIRSLTQDPAIERLPAVEQETFQRTVATARDTLAPADAFFRQYSSAPEIERRIKPSNYADILTQADRHGQEIANVRDHIASAQTILQRQTDLDRIASETASLAGALGNWSDTPAFEQRAKNALADVKLALERRDPDAARAAIGIFTQARQNRTQFADLRARVDGTYATITGAGCPENATAPAKEIYQTFTSATAGADIAKMSSAARQLEDFATGLTSTYELRVVGGIWIYQNRDPSQRSFYLKVQAVDDKPVWLPMQDDDRGGVVSSTPMWGEAIPEEVYQAVGRDKKDNGIIDNAIMGRKQRCSTTPNYEYRVPLPNGTTFTLNASRSRITPVNPRGDLSQDRSWRD